MGEHKKELNRNTMMASGSHFPICDKLCVSLLEEKIKFFAAMDASVPTLSPTQDAVNLLVSLPAKRAQSVILAHSELSQIRDLLCEYDSSSSRRAAPSKAQLHAAVSALLHPKANKLSQKWNKGQLAAVLGRWVQEALSIQKPELQLKLCLEINPAGQREPGVLYIEEDDGSVATFAINSPNKPARETIRMRNVPTPPTDVDDEDPSHVPTPSTSEIGPLGTPSSVATSATSFMRQLDEVAGPNGFLAATPGTVSNPPGVGNSSSVENASQEVPADNSNFGGV